MATITETGTAGAAKATAGKAVKKDKPDQKFTATLLLPKTAFPLRSEPKAQETFRQRCTSDLYPWQVRKTVAFYHVAQKWKRKEARGGNASAAMTDMSFDPKL